MSRRSLRKAPSSGSLSATVKKSTSNLSIQRLDQHDEENYDRLDKTVLNVPLDISVFDSERFDEKTYLNSVLGRQKIGEETLRTLQAHLTETRDATSKYLKKNVFKHYNEFVSISKEISQFESDMILIKSLLKDMRFSMEVMIDEISENRPEGEYMFQWRMTEALKLLL